MSIQKGHVRKLFLRQERVRQKIEDLDARIIDLLGERMAHARTIGQIKCVLGIPIYRPLVERRKLARAIESASKKGLDGAFVRKLMRVVFQESRRVQRVTNRNRKRA